MKINRISQYFAIFQSLVTLWSPLVLPWLFLENFFSVFFSKSSVFGVFRVAKMRKTLLFWYFKMASALDWAGKLLFFLKLRFGLPEFKSTATTFRYHGFVRVYAK